MHALGKKRYPGRFDSIGAENWFRNICLKQPLIFYPARLTNSFCISMLSIQPWIPSEWECNIVFICCDDGCMWEGMRLLRSSIAWAKSRKCSTWKISSDTDTDLAAMAKRLGATEIFPRYALRL